MMDAESRHVTWHQNPRTAYELMLDATGLDCSMYGCWKPIRAFVLVPVGGGCGRGVDNELGVCEEHARGKQVTRWLES